MSKRQYLRKVLHLAREGLELCQEYGRLTGRPACILEDLRELEFQTLRKLGIPPAPKYPREDERQLVDLDREEQPVIERNP